MCRSRGPSPTAPAARATCTPPAAAARSVAVAPGRSSASSARLRPGPPGQGSRMSLAGDDPEHVVVVPGGLLAPAAEAGLAAAVAGDQVEGDLAQEGEVAGGGAVAHPAVILAEGDVENPMQGVLDAPVPADRPGQDGGSVAAAGEQVADLGLGLAGAVDAADRLHRQHGAEIGPAAQALELPAGGAREDAPADQAAVALV